MTVRALTRQLVSIPSHDDPTAAGSAIEAWLRSETDATVERTDAGVIARRDGGGRCALVGHHDVVPPADEQTDDGEYVIHERDDRLSGRGSADMKGSLAAALCAFRDADGPCTIASFRGEEQGGVGAQRAIEAGFAPEYAVVIEGSTGYSADGVTDVAVAHKGRRASTIHATGTAAHASEPEHGTNAVYRATEAVGVLQELLPPETRVLGHDLRGRLCVTGIEGGSAWNVVPDSCAITVDERTVPDERADIGRVTAIDGVTWDVEQDLPPMACDDDAFAHAVLDAATAAQSSSPALVTKPHATDAGWLAQAGTTCVVCGAAEPGEAHTDDESVSLPVLERCYRIYRNLLSRIEGWD
ncbi:M20 family metallopeptidase [Halocatena pleomorpha]|uniref:M20 family peptidase n=1 Tax=Halocatena pleomorpha TaxID=1785090 RepID=A0A3P3RI95_9EURY|nr:M20/M25/M40 family metallo-hydrolase [Halocatena pleomorpha]RRJ33132.1 M20 family peptidase [Halocatena pleomorpha]